MLKMGDQALEHEKINQTASVTSVGSSWIICRSKSHSGRIYYFNTLTGEAAWNLSDAEIEKAKSRTNFLRSQSGVELDACPEPKEPPIDIKLGCNTGGLQSTPIICGPRVYNKQIINNQFSKQSYAPSTGRCTNCSAHTAQCSADVNVPVPQRPPSNIWTIPLNHQIVISPSPTVPLLSQFQEPNNTGYTNVDANVPVQNTSLPLSRRFNLMQPSRPNNYQQRSSPFYKKFNKKDDSIDLRQKLSAKRSFNWNTSAQNVEYQDTNANQRAFMQKIQIIKPVMETITPSDEDDKWLKENATFKGSMLVLNVAPLKNIVTSGTRSTFWYVVADSNVLLNNINLINVIVNSDSHCQLMVPDYIMAELQNSSRLSDTLLMSRAHSVLQILSQLFSSGCAVIGKDPVPGMEKRHIFDFCKRLSQQDHNVVLVSNNIPLENERNTIIMLTIQELKDFLSNEDKSTRARKYMGSLSEIKITVPNDTNKKNIDKLGISNSSEEIKSMNNTSQFHIKPNNTALHKVQKDVHESIKTHNAVNNKKSTKDVGIQVDLISTKSTESCPQKMDRSTITENDMTGFSDSLKPRGIQLKRNLSHTATDNNEEKKQFKWRRRKRIEYAPNKSASEGKLETSTTVQENPKFDKPSTNKEIFNRESKNTCYDEPYDGSETSSSCCIQKNVLDKIVIEETSTSGIISNSASNVDCESIQGVNPENNDPKCGEEKDSNKCAMFEVDSPVMEENLRTRCDEWISRFVQIMEEVLTQILQRGSSFFNLAMPPPWSIHEATECIKRKFDNDSDVVDAANKLNCLLFHVSDSRGKIKAELKPAEFMKMYSYGVYLVDSLQSVLSTCEDLQTAADSLAKLLGDISDPNQDTGHADSFIEKGTGHVDSFMETSGVSDANVSLFGIGNASCEEAKTSKEKMQSEKSPNSSPALTSPRKYNLRSTFQKSIENQKEIGKTIELGSGLNKECKFFNSLDLHKNNNVSYNTEQCSSEEKEENNKTDAAIRAFSHTNDESQDVTPKIEPKIIRNFSRCIEYEERLRNKLNGPFGTADDPLDNNTQIEEGEIVDHDGYDEDQPASQYEYDYYDHEDYDSCDDMETVQDNKENGFLLEEEYKNVDENSNIIYNQMVKKLRYEMQDAFLEVQNFCEKTRNELCASPSLTPARKIEILDKAEKARSYMNVLCLSIKSILGREDTDCKNNIQAILNEAGIHLDVAVSDEYRKMISKYSSQATILLEAVHDVIEAVS